MRKVLSVTIAFMMILCLVSCSSPTGNTGTNSTETINAQSNESEPVVAKEPLDLTGQWIQENNNKENYMTAVIRDDGKIGVFFILEGDEKAWTYWVGTYDAPTDSTDEYSWVSKNTYGGSGLLASNADTKSFSYKNGKLSYEVTVSGNTGTFNLVKGNWDTKSIPESAFNTERVSQSDFKSLEITDYGWLIKGEKWVYYYAVLHNPNTDIAVEFPTVRATARDSNGGLLGTDDHTLSVIYPGQDFIFGHQAFSVDEMPAKVEVTALAPDSYKLKKNSLTNTYTPLEVESASLRSGKYLGEVKNPNNYDIDKALITCLGKNASGEVVSIDYGFVDQLKAGSTTPFSVMCLSNAEISSVECYANQW